MKLDIHYFASVREHLGTTGESLEVPGHVQNVHDLVSHLSARGKAWSLLQDDTQVLIAVNQTITTRDHALSGSDEIAFFPPMTGG